MKTQTHTKPPVIPTEFRDLETDLKGRNNNKQYQSIELDILNVDLIHAAPKPDLLGDAGITTVQKTFEESRKMEGSFFYEDPNEVMVREQALKNKVKRVRKQKPWFWKTRVLFLRSNVRKQSFLKKKKEQFIEFCEACVRAFRPRKPKFNLKAFVKAFQPKEDRIDLYKKMKFGKTSNQ